VGIAKARSETRVVEQRRLTKGRAGASATATLLHGWHIYLGFAAVGIGLFIGFIRWNRKY
jgi:hypothetical protein